MHPVIQIDIRMPGRAVQRGVASCEAGSGMARRIGFYDVRFDFNDRAGSRSETRVVDENLAEQSGRDLQRRPRIVRSRQFHYGRGGALSLALNLMRSIACCAARAVSASGSFAAASSAGITFGSREKPSTPATSARVSGDVAFNDSASVRAIDGLSSRRYRTASGRTAESRSDETI